MNSDTLAFWELVTGCAYDAFKMYIFFFVFERRRIFS
jgi:hypothetical protein